MISDDWVVRYANRFFQLEAESRNYAPARGKVVVGEGPEGRVEIEYRGRAVRWREIAAPVPPRLAEPRKHVTTAPAPVAQRTWVPPADHPWRQGAERRAARQASAGITVGKRPSWAGPSAAP